MSSNTDTLPRWPGLTAAEERVAHRLVLGATAREIADELGNSFKTIETHRIRVLRKIGVRSTVALTRYAIRNGLTTADGNQYDTAESACVRAARERWSREPAVAAP